MSTAKQDLDRQLHAQGEVGIPAERTFVDTKSGSTTDRPELRALLGYARDNGRVGYQNYPNAVVR